MAERGASYRSNFETLADDAEFQNLSPLAQAVFHTLKLKLGPYGIAVFYASLLQEYHRRSTSAEIAAALDELEQPKREGLSRGWIRRDRNMMWIVNGLRFEPNLSLSHGMQRRGAALCALSLPSREGIASEFLEYYGLTKDALALEAKASRKPLATLTRPSRDSESESERESERERESESERKDLDQERAAPGGSASKSSSTSASNGAATAPLFRSLPEDVHRFCRTFYDHATHREKLHVRDEILATLTPGGLKVGRRSYVRAVSTERLASKCREVLEEHAHAPLRDPAKAWVVVVRKLADWSDVSAQRVEADREQLAGAERDSQAASAAADVWGTEHPDEFKRIQEQAAREFPGDSEFTRLTRESWILTRIRHAMTGARPVARAEAVAHAGSA